MTTIRQSTIDKYVNRRYGRLTVQGIVGRDPNHKFHYFMQCKCDCGKECVTRLSGMQQGSTKSCGCLANEHRKKGAPGNTYRRMGYGENAFKRMLVGYKAVARQKGVPFSLSDSEFAALTKLNCFYCGCEPAGIYAVKNAHGEYVYNGVDRLDPSIGYTTNNCVPACKRCNSLKNGITKEMVYKLYHRLFP